MKNSGIRKTLIGNSWYSMMQRCYNPKNTSFIRYGGSGIYPCEFIKSSPLNLILLIGERTERKYSLERIDNKKGYHCGSCSECISKGLSKNIKWATRHEQCRNRKTNLIIQHDGKSLCLKDWARFYKIDRGAISRRWKMGLRGDALFSPTRPRRNISHFEV